VKLLRLNTEPSPGLIPADNPCAGSPVYSFGHRNPQGLDFGSVDGGASYILYSSEHGDQSDDEVNIILPHINYGWPKIAGLCDDNYTSTSGDSMYLAGKAVVSEHGFCDTTHTTLQEPIFSFYNWGRSANKTSGALGNMSWPTIAPSAIRFYGHSAIPGWNYSLLIPSLKNGLWRLKLKPDGLSIDSTVSPTDTLHYLPGYRLRNVTVAPSGDTLFLAVDNSCCTLGAAGVIGNSAPSPATGYILRMVYLTTLALQEHAKGRGAVQPAKVYPNPAHGVLNVETESTLARPLRVELCTITGLPVLTREADSNKFSLNIGAIHPGVYILRLFSMSGELMSIEKVNIY
ncbi:MAG: PQQ-dependent sugar dehydrogenase, partial [Bacteroidetes bacterium]|nr:PQQ-dependent sugar dehydrogenase [Bacteroidota bacterium]